MLVRNAALALCALLVGSGPAGELQVGQPFPDFTLPAIDDRRPLSLADFRGSKLLLVEFASW